MFTKFPNLERINLQNNPLSAKNLSNLSSEQFGKLVNGIKEKKIRIDSFKGTVLMDLLDYAQKLVSQGRPEYQAHVQTLNSINQPNQTNEPPNNKSPLLISGVVILVAISALVIGYLWGKKSNKFLIMNKKQQLLTSLISEINKPQPRKETIISDLSELENETKKDCSHCQHQKYAEQISAIKAGKWEQKN